MGNKIIVRSLYGELKSRLEEPRRFIQVIARPRQVGKTTLVEQVLNDITIPYSKETADSVAPSDREWISREWDADQYVYFGGFPGPADLISDENRWRKYIFGALIAPSIEKDVIMTSNIYKPALMDRLFALGCSYSAEILSLTKMIEHLKDAGNVTTLANYLTLLEQSDLLTGLQKYSRNILRKYNSIPKFSLVVGS